LLAREQKQLWRARFCVYFHDNKRRASQHCMFGMERVLVRAQVYFQARANYLQLD
jgi:hypothetical protein